MAESPSKSWTYYVESSAARHGHVSAEPETLQGLAYARHQGLPIGELLGREDARLAIPGIMIGAELRPAATGDDEPGFNAERAGKRRRGGRRRNHQIEARRERRRTVEVVLQIEIVEIVNGESEFLARKSNLGRNRAVLQIDERNVGKRENRPPRLYGAVIFRAFRRQDHRAPANADIGPGTKRRKTRAEARSGFSIGRQIRLARKVLEPLAHKKERRADRRVEIGVAGFSEPKKDSHGVFVELAGPVRPSLCCKGRKMEEGHQA